MGTGIWYATREQVQSSLEISYNARAKKIIDQKIESSSRAVEGLLHRRFYPEIATRYFDWPNNQLAATWQLWLGDNELISATALVSGGTTITASNYFLRRSDDKDEPPYNLVEINLAGTGAFSAGATFQRAIGITGEYGHNATSTAIASAALSGGINSSVTTIVLNPTGGIYDVGVGAIVLLGTERLILTERRMSDTGQNLQSNMAALQSDSVVDVTDGTAFSEGEVLLLDSERMRIDDIAGNNLICTRAFDGTTLTAHTAPVDIYAARTWIVQRGALGTTTASHLNADPAYVHKFPALINELCIAETVVALEQNSSGYARTVGSGPNTREAGGKGLEDIRYSAYTTYGRKQRSTAI